MKSWIALIEDDEIQAELIAAAFNISGYSPRFVTFNTGESAIEHLSSLVDTDPPAKLPALIILDLGLPKSSGIDVLKALRDLKLTPRVPVVVVSSSKLPKDLIDAFGHGALSYFQKPVNNAGLAALVDVIGRRWLDAI